MLLHSVCPGLSRLAYICLGHPRLRRGVAVEQSENRTMGICMCIVHAGFPARAFHFAAASAVHEHAHV